MFVLAFSSSSLQIMRQSARVRIDAGTLAVADDTVVTALRSSADGCRAVFASPRGGVVAAIISASSINGCLKNPFSNDCFICLLIYRMIDNTVQHF